MDKIVKSFSTMEATYTETRSNFAKLWDKVIDHREPLTIHRRGSEDVVLLPASELSSLQETAHLLRSPRNAQRLLEALWASFDQQGEEVKVEALKRTV
jgi:antitoxin YefM